MRDNQYTTGFSSGPTFIYINDSPRTDKLNASMFADDTQIEESSDDINVITDKLNKDLRNVSTWMLANKLTLNQAKTEYTMIGSNKIDT
jgi:hypothetical protein